MRRQAILFVTLAVLALAGTPAVSAQSTGDAMAPQGTTEMHDDTAMMADHEAMTPDVAMPGDSAMMSDADSDMAAGDGHPMQDQQP